MVAAFITRVHENGLKLVAVAAPSASPTPTPSPVPATAPGLSPGELAVVRTTDAAGATLAPAAVTVGCMPNAQNCANVASESGRRPSLPVELGGVAVSVNGAAAGLYFVSPNEIQFVVPPALAPSTSSGYPVVVTIREGNAVRTVRSALVVVAAQPDLLLRDATANRALITNITNPLLAMGTFEPFTVMTTYTDGTTNLPVTARTTLRAMLTGVRGVTRSQVTVRLVRADNTNIDITGADIISDAVATDLPGIYQLDFRLPDAAAAAGDVRVIINVSNASATFSSRATDTAPLIRIN